MRNVGCKDNRKGVTLAVMTAAIVRRSRIIAKSQIHQPKANTKLKKELL